MNYARDKQRKTCKALHVEVFIVKYWGFQAYLCRAETLIQEFVAGFDGSQLYWYERDQSSYWLDLHIDCRQHAVRSFNNMFE